MIDSVKPNNCGNCAFSRPAGEMHPAKVNCIFGGETRGPFNRKCAACVTYRPNKVAYREIRNRQDEQIRQRILDRKLAKKEEPARIKPEDIPKLKEYYFNYANLSDIARYFHVTRQVVILTVAEQGWKRSSSASSTKAIDLMENQSKTAESVPVKDQKYRGVRPCKGQCCKYKLYCKHYLRWVEVGKPSFGCIGSVSYCISGTGDKILTQRFANFLPADGYSDIGEISFAEACE